MTDPTPTTRHAHVGRLYNLLALGFDRPSEQLTDELRSGSFGSILVESAAVCAKSDNGQTHRVETTAGETNDGDARNRLLERAAAVAEAAPTDEAGLETLRSTYADAFGFEHGGRISQYQVEYSPRTLLTSTTVLADIAGFYEAFGLSKVDGNRDRVDHLCLELEFAAYVSLQAATLSEAGDEEGFDIVRDARASFLEDHLGRWIPRFREAVIEETDSAFYQSLAAFGCDLVAADCHLLGAEPTVFPEDPPNPMAAFENEDEGNFRCNTCSMATPGGPSGHADGSALPDR